MTAPIQPPIQIIEDAKSLQTLCDQLRGSNWLTLDTEFIRERTYYTELCLIQIANADIVACIDPIKLCENGQAGNEQAMAEALMPFKTLIYDTKTVKVLHAAHQDMEIFYNLWGELPAPIFDTQVAATLAGQPDQVGYGNLVNNLTGTELDKGQSRTDWKARPLADAQIQYAANDVTYLRDVYQILLEKLQSSGRLEWLAADFERVSQPATYQMDDDLRWSKVKGHDRLQPAQLGILRCLAAWREAQARQANRPRQWILKDASLIDLAKLGPKNTDALNRLRGLSEQTLKRHGDTLLERIHEGAQQPIELSDSRSNKPSPQQQVLIDVLSAAVSIIAHQSDISPGTLGTRKQLIRFLSNSHESPLMQGWHAEVVGKPLLALLAGELSIHVKDQHPQLRK